MKRGRFEAPLPPAWGRKEADPRVDEEARRNLSDIASMEVVP
jgi:hypothetical protein